MNNKQRVKTSRELLNEIKVLIEEYKIGQGKRKYMLKELGNAVDVMKKVKNAFDPNKIMNPGKLFL